MDQKIETALADILPAVTVYTASSCETNPGRGGWGAVLHYDARPPAYVRDERELWGGEAYTTNNAMELRAAIEALEDLEEPFRVTLYTDSEYLRMGITKWLATWKSKAWMTAQKRPVKNVDLWQRLDKAQARHNVTWKWISRTSGNVWNERAAALAAYGINDQVSPKDPVRMMREIVEDSYEKCVDEMIEAGMAKPLDLTKSLAEIEKDAYEKWDAEIFAEAFVDRPKKRQKTRSDV